MKLSLILWSLAFTFACQEVSSAQDLLNQFEKLTFQNETDESLNYRLLSPKIEKGKKYPLVLFFHGAGERGSDNQKQLIHGMKDFASEQVSGKYFPFVIAPQCPKNQQWVDVPWNAKSHTMPEKPSNSMRLSLQLLEKFIETHPVDKNRVYVTGLSMGGYGTFDAISRKPGLFAAALPVCGGGDEKVADRIKALPIWIVHGDADRVVLPSRSTNMFDAIKKAGGKPKLTMIKGVGHNSWSATYANPATYEWLFAQRNK